MQINHRSFLFSISVLFLSYSLNAQGATETANTDSIQRILMRDSLQMGDGLINEVLATKRNYFISVDQIRSNGSLNPEQQNSQIQTLRAQTTTNLRALLGNELYERYSAMIERRMKLKNPAFNKKPLAEGIGN